MARRLNCLAYPVVASLWLRVQRACRRSSLRWPSYFSPSARAAAFCWPGDCSRSISPVGPPTIWISSPPRLSWVTCHQHATNWRLPPGGEVGASNGLLLARAAEIDAGFDVQVLADMIATLARFTDADIPLPDQPVSALRVFFEDWHSELTA